MSLGVQWQAFVEAVPSSTFWHGPCTVVRVSLSLLWLSSRHPSSTLGVAISFWTLGPRSRVFVGRTPPRISPRCLPIGFPAALPGVTAVAAVFLLLQFLKKMGRQINLVHHLATPSTNAKKRSRFFQYNLLNNLLKKTRRKSNSHSEGSCHLVMKLLTGSAVAQPLFEVTPAFGHAELVTVGI